MDRTRTLYDILQVSEHAEPEVVEAAYRRLARMYHPDLNKSPDATVRMQQINGAYGVLKNAETRAAYDNYLRSVRGQTKQQEMPTADIGAQEETTWQKLSAFAEAVAPQVACQKCGVIDSTVRIRVFPYVVSALILSFRRASVGILCENCAREIGWRNSIISVLVGTWGIPFGFFWTLGALFTNLGGGNQPMEPNAALLHHIGVVLLAKGYFQEARRALQAALDFGGASETRELLDSLTTVASSEPARQQDTLSKLRFGSGLWPSPQPLGVSGGLVFLGSIATVFLAFYILGQVFSNINRPKAPLPTSTRVTTPAPPTSTPVSSATRAAVVASCQKVYPFIKRATQQISTFNTLNQASATQANVSVWRRLQADASSLASDVERLATPPADLQDVYRLLRSWAISNKATMDNYVAYLTTGSNTYLAQANREISLSNTTWKSLLDAWSAVLAKYQILTSEL